MGVMKTRQIGVALMTGLLCGPAVANAATGDGEWQHSLAIYTVAASIDGKAGVGPVEGDIDVSFSDIMDNLDWGFMGAYRGERGPWAVGLDVMYLALESEAKGLGPLGEGRVEADGDQLVTQLNLGYALTPHLDAYVGARYWQVDADLTLRGGGPLEEVIKVSGTEDWVDPVVGLRYEAPLADRWEFVAMGDVGGFGVGSDFSWHVTAFAAWKAGEHARVIVGYRHIDVDYDDGKDRNRFLWDLAEGGPMVGFAWQF